MSLIPSSSSSPVANSKASAPIDVTLSSFVAEVVNASRQALIISVFWTPRSSQCKQFVAMLEKLVKAAGEHVRLARADIDQTMAIAQQLGVSSVPAVYAFYNGQPVDGFMGEVPEAQVTAWLDRLVKALGIAGLGQDKVGLDKALKQAADFLSVGDSVTAQSIYADILDMEPENAPAYAGLARCLLQSGALEEVKKLLEAAPEAVGKDKALDPIRTALALAEETQKAAGEIALYQERLAKNPKDHQARFDLAMGYYATGAREEAVDELLTIIQADRAWNDEAARKQLVKFFEAFGPTDPVTLSARRRLSSILFS